MNEIVFLFGMFAGIAIAWGAYYPLFSKEASEIKDRCAMEVTAFKLQFIDKMATADRYIVGQVELKDNQKIENSLILCKDVDCAIKMSGNYCRVSGVNLQSFDTGVIFTEL